MLVFSLAACTSSSAPAADAGAADATASDGGGSDASSEIVTGDGGGGACVVRPACNTCYDAGQACCLSPNPSPPPEYATTCAACPADAGLSYITLGCGDDADCPGKVCCIKKTGTLIVSACAAACDTTQGEAQLCDANAATTSCPAASPCSKGASDAWGIPHCYGTCGPTPPPP